MSALSAGKLESEESLPIPNTILNGLDAIIMARPERGYRYGELVDFFWPRWVVRLSSGYEFSVYEDEFEVED